MPHITCDGDLHMKHTFMSSISLVIFIFLPFIVYLMYPLYHWGLTFANPEGGYSDYRTHMGVMYVTLGGAEKG